MKILNPQIELKDYLFSRIYNALQGNVVNWIVDKAEYMTDDEDWREHVNGNFMKLDEHLLPDFFHLSGYSEYTWLDEKEINFIYNVGDMMKLSAKEISRVFADMIQRNYIPSLESIC